MSMRLDAQDEKARAELTLARRRTKGTNNAARVRKANRMRAYDPPEDFDAMRPYIFGEEDRS
jgi:hypothetical protein